MTEATPGHVVVLHFDHELRLERHPVSRAFRRPAAGTTRRIAGEAAPFQPFQLRRERRPIGTAERGGEAHVIEQARPIVEAEQQRADFPAATLPRRRITEAADHAVGPAQVLDLEHRSLARLVGFVETLRDDAVEGTAAGAAEPRAGVAEPRRLRRETQRVCLAQGGEEAFERGAAIGQGPRPRITPLLILKEIEGDQQRRRPFGEAPDAAGRRMQPHLQRRRTGSCQRG